MSDWAPWIAGLGLGGYAVASGWLVDALSRHSRPRAVMAGAAMVVTGACLAFALVGCGDEYERGAGVYTSTTPMVTQSPVVVPVTPVAPTQQPAVEPEGTEADPVSRREKRIVVRAKRNAKVFLRGYLPYSYGRGNASKIRRAHPDLLAELKRNPPRPVPGLETEVEPRLERWASAEVVDDGRAVLAAQITDGAALMLTLEPRGRSWVVREVR